jgi:hypothetical protein
MNRLTRSFRFVWEHKAFTLFAVCCFALNVYLVLQRDSARERFISASTYDAGPLGTQAFYENLLLANVAVSRLQLPPFRQLKHDRDQGMTLIMLSPMVKPSAWEWEFLMQWVANGNRLVTAGLYGPQTFWSTFQQKNQLEHTFERIGPVRVSLPVDTVFPYPEALSPLQPVEKILLGEKAYTRSDSAAFTSFKTFQPNTLPFLTHHGKAIAVKKAIGRGEWVLFTPANPFSNTNLRDSTWYRFATRLLTADQRYAGTVYFDEFHNGYTATQSLWQLLRYYRFDQGLIFGALLILLYLFFTGVRIITPGPRFDAPSRDVLTGMRSMSLFLYRHNGWNALVRNEARYVSAELRRRLPGHSTSWHDIAAEYCRRFRLPPSVRDCADLADQLAAMQAESLSLSKRAATAAFNTLVYLRKEMKT